MVRGSNYSANNNCVTIGSAESPNPYYPWVTFFIAFLITQFIVKQICQVW